MTRSRGHELKRAIINRIPGTGRLKVPRTWNRTYTRAFGDLRREEGDGFALVSYVGADGFDYQAYCRIQEEGNRAKLHGQWVTRDHIRKLAAFVTGHGVIVRHGICHGTRRGHEQVWFSEALGNGAEVIGTEISPTATDFPHTVRWDFHETNPDWVGQMDLVYSNSWDHAYDPDTAFSVWIDSLAPGGVLIVDHSRYHLPDRANELDPFGANLDVLRQMVSRIGAARGALIGTIEDSLSDDTTTAPVDLPVVALVWRRHN